MLGDGNDTNQGSLQSISKSIRMTDGFIRYGLNDTRNKTSISGAKRFLSEAVYD